MGTFTAPAHSPGKYLTFRLARQDYAVEATRVRGIVPATAGRVAIFKGCEIPLVDLRAKLDLPGGAATPRSSVVVVEAAAGPVGFVVDRVASVLLFRERDMRSGAVWVHGRRKRLLNLDELLA